MSRNHRIRVRRNQAETLISPRHEPVNTPKPYTRRKLDAMTDKAVRAVSEVAGVKWTGPKSTRAAIVEATAHDV